MAVVVVIIIVVVVVTVVRRVLMVVVVVKAAVVVGSGATVSTIYRATFIDVFLVGFGFWLMINSRNVFLFLSFLGGGYKSLQ